MARKSAFRIRMSDTEQAILDRRAAQAGMNPTQYARKALFGTKQKPHPLWPQFLQWLDAQSTEKTPEANVVTKSKKDEEIRVEMKVKKKKISKTNALEFAATTSLPSYRRIAEPGALLKK